MANHVKALETSSSSILPLELSFEIETVMGKGLKFTGQQDGEIESCLCPIFSYNGKNLDLLMYLIWEFRSIAVTFEWDAERQHMRTCCFGRVLGAADRFNWEEIVESIPLDTVYNFNLGVDQFKASYMPRS